MLHIFDIECGFRRASCSAHHGLGHRRASIARHIGGRISIEASHYMMIRLRPELPPAVRFRFH